MKNFPTTIGVSHRHEFSDMRYDRVMCCLRLDVYESVLGGDENDYIDIGSFYTKYKVIESDSKSMTDNIMSELGSLGWNCKLSFGSTALFVYSTENPPSSCWDDTF
jgi:hypothetical protein